eukprot:TRINITY_DN1371_c0_g1_i1.p1 TRINITY_DN1371_c0_g1~~TRINITY_DN1371_c0_g1_i1.p1  ORF type:complete len:413 (-),score=161.38 TRINITY_DN1371_c0_g1_i1:141-1328(-)
MSSVVIVSAVRTPIGSHLGVFHSIPGPKLGVAAVKGALGKVPALKPSDVQEVIFGNVVSAGVGQAPARQVALGAGLPESVICTTVNKVCSSGMKAVMYGAQSIQLQQSDIVVAGGFESMSNVPFYLPGARTGYKYNHHQVVDGIIQDGLWCPHDHHHMGHAGEKCAKTYNFTRQAQDNYAIESFKRANAAAKRGAFAPEIVPVPLVAKKGAEPQQITEDESYKKVNFDKIPTLKPAFDPSGSITAANASSINDGASALILMSEEKAKALGLKPLARIRGYADAERAPSEFTIAPALAAPKALKAAKLDIKDVDFWEINEAFSVVALANMEIMKLDHARVNVNGGAVAIGHPIGCSGARIITTLVHVLKEKNGKIGCATICNGGGGASAIVIENLI